MTANLTSAGPGKDLPAALSKRHLDTLRHMLGINDPSVGRPKPHRDYAAVNPGDAEFAELTALGAVERYRCASSGFPYDYYRCTDAGRAAAMASHKDIRWSKSKRIYSKFLEVRDALGDVSFKEFLTNSEFKQTRDAA
jgi:hypothetical protein